MATTDKHPPLDPRRHSTNKRVKAKTGTSMGTAYKTASGSRRISPGDGSKPVVKTVGPYKTANMLKAEEAEEKKRGLAKKRQEGRVLTLKDLRTEQKSKKVTKT